MLRLHNLHSYEKNVIYRDAYLNLNLNLASSYYHNKCPILFRSDRYKKTVSKIYFYFNNVAQ